MNNQSSLGVTEEMISAAEGELGIRFPEMLRDAWKAYNCVELRGGWRVFPIFDPANPRKTAGSITYENIKGSWGQVVMEQGLVSIADNGTGNQLVLKVHDGRASVDAFHWQHDTNALRPWKAGLGSILTSAAKSREKISKLQAKFKRP
ncbi:MAG: SMI1/KNR4 family protein [Betaproteobacteria bacterium]|nr:SMI1/KNR4 family protein [Betaproteobacteria bacterium]